MTDGSDQRPQEIVASGYDRLAERYGVWSAGVEGDARDHWLEELVALLAEGARVLDLGCGPGLTARVLAPRSEVVGVDISEHQIAIAREAVPRATFIVADMSRVEFDSASFDAVVALYSLIHLPLTELGPMLVRISNWLRPDGLLLATLGTVAGEGVQDDWLGVPMFFAGNEPERNRELLASAGFAPARDEVLRIHEPEEGDVDVHWVLARRRPDTTV